MIMMIVIESAFLVLLVYLIFMLFFYKIIKDMEFMSSYECGFDSNCFTRLTFSYRFFMISILFIIFDVEVSLMLPIPYLLEEEMSIYVFYLFILILMVGLIYEYYYGSLEWLDIMIKS